MTTPDTWRPLAYADSHIAVTPTGALGLYQRLGLVTYHRTIAFTKELS
jgi:hypothetical protein